MSDTMKWPDEITALRARVHQLLVERDNLERENAALKKNKERMDWLATEFGGYWAVGHLEREGPITRKAIDQAIDAEKEVICE